MARAVPFIRFPSILNHYKDGWVDLCRGAAPGEWVVTEKVHGANFMIAAWKGGACAGRRSSWIDEKGGEVFHGLKYDAEFLDLGSKAQRALGELPDADVVYLFGEIFGGGSGGSRAVQKEIKYTHDVSIVFFDVLYTDKGHDVHWLPRREAERVCLSANLPWVATLFRGTLDDAMRFSEEHYRDPTGWGTGSIREGNVIMPEETTWVYMGGQRTRVGIKHKSPEFTERGNLVETSSSDVELVKSFINNARWDSVRSKEREDLDIATGIRLLVEDALAEAGVSLTPTELRACKTIAARIIKT